MEVIVIDKIGELLAKLSMPPSVGTPEWDQWIEQTNILNLLNYSVGMDRSILYASIGSTFIHTVLVPNELLQNPDIDDLLSWNGNVYSSWSVVQSGQTQKNLDRVAVIKFWIRRNIKRGTVGFCQIV